MQPAAALPAALQGDKAPVRRASAPKLGAAAAAEPPAALHGPVQTPAAPWQDLQGGCRVRWPACWAEPGASCWPSDCRTAPGASACCARSALWGEQPPRHRLPDLHSGGQRPQHHGQGRPEPDCLVVSVNALSQILTPAQPSVHPAQRARGPLCWARSASSGLPQSQ